LYFVIIAFISIFNSSASVCQALSYNIFVCSGSVLSLEKGLIIVC